KQEMMDAVVTEMNRIYRKFVARNPSFVKNGGKVSIFGHSLGSVLAMDILIHQKPSELNHLSLDQKYVPRDENMKIELDFAVNNFFAVGSPIGVFLLLKGCKLASRSYKPPFGIHAATSP